MRPPASADHARTRRTLRASPASPSRSHCTCPPSCGERDGAAFVDSKSSHYLFIAVCLLTLLSVTYFAQGVGVTKLAVCRRSQQQGAR